MKMVRVCLLAVLLAASMYTAYGWYPGAEDVKDVAEQVDTNADKIARLRQEIDLLKKKTTAAPKPKSTSPAKKDRKWYEIFKKQ